MNKRARGRPRQYTHEQAMAGAVDIFSRKGFSGASLDELALAMQMNRPSIYNAFGDKEAVYRQALQFFVEHLRAAMRELVVDEPDLKTALTNAYLTALSVYFAQQPARGCFMFCTAPVEALNHPEIHADMAALLAELDGLFEAKLREAQLAGHYPADADIKSVAKLAQGILHTLAIRSRAGESQTSLKRLVKTAVPMLCGTP
jgi:TetR/AcrR family transcriptional regulator, copper-responsive repressor